MFHNFSIHKNSLIIATDKFILKQLAAASSSKPIEHLAVKTLVLCHLPFEQFTHPYQQALASRFENSFEEFSLPRAVYNFHRILQFFNTKLLEEIHIYDSKITKAYAQDFKSYLKAFPQIQIVE